MRKVNGVDMVEEVLTLPPNAELPSDMTVQQVAWPCQGGTRHHRWLAQLCQAACSRSVPQPCQCLPAVQGPCKAGGWNLASVRVQAMPPEVWCAWEAQQAAQHQLQEDGLEAAVKLGGLGLDDLDGCLGLAARMLPPSQARLRLSHLQQTALQQRGRRKHPRGGLQRLRSRRAAALGGLPTARQRRAQA